MSKNISRKTVLDATVLSNYATSDSIEYLIDILSRPLTVSAVNEELQHGYDDGYEFLENALDYMIFEGSKALNDPNYNRQNYNSILISNVSVKRDEIKRKLEAGEAEALYYALLYGGVLATDDGDARELAREYDVSVTGSLGLLVKGIKQEEVTVSVANEWLSEWQSTGYYSPVDDVRELSDRF